MQLDAAGGWIDADANAGNGITGTAWAGTDGQNFTQFAAQNGVLVYIETEISDAVRLMRSCHESVEPIRTLFACVVSIPMCKT